MLNVNIYAIAWATYLHLSRMSCASFTAILITRFFFKYYFNGHYKLVRRAPIPAKGKKRLKGTKYIAFVSQQEQVVSKTLAAANKH